MATLKNVELGHCPFCGCDPYEYVDVGVTTCCSAGIAYFQYGKTLHQIHKMQRELKRDEKKRGNIISNRDVIMMF